MTILSAELILYTDRNFGGMHTHIWGIVPDLSQFLIFGSNAGSLSTLTWNDQVSSFVIQSGIWQFFRDVNYVNAYGNGEGAPANYGPTAFGPGRYGWVEQVGMANDSISSIRMLAETPIVI